MEPDPIAWRAELLARANDLQHHHPEWSAAACLAHAWRWLRLFHLITRDNPQ